MTSETDHADVFIGHSWSAGRWPKFLALCLSLGFTDFTESCWHAIKTCNENANLLIYSCIQCTDSVLCLSPSVCVSSLSLFLSSYFCLPLSLFLRVCVFVSASSVFVGLYQSFFVCLCFDGASPCPTTSVGVLGSFQTFYRTIVYTPAAAAQTAPLSTPAVTHSSNSSSRSWALCN